MSIELGMSGDDEEVAVVGEPAPAEAIPMPLGGELVPTRARRLHPRSLLGMALIGGATIAAALLGRAAIDPKSRRWYRRLSKPSWTPPDKAFALVWPVLYSLSAVSAWRVWRSPPTKLRTTALGMWAAQVATSGAWPRTFFGKRRPGLALVDAEANVGAAAAYALAAGKIDRAAGLLVLPYIGWVTFAGALNASLVRRNR